MIPSQMLKGILEGCILKIISFKETYGYEISQELKTFGFDKISEGTIYPLLLRLERNNLIVATYKASTGGPKRKYFTLTAEGHKELDSFFDNWQEMSDVINNLFGKGELENEK